MPGVCACAFENLMMAKKPEILRANIKMACRWVLMYYKGGGSHVSLLLLLVLAFQSILDLGYEVCYMPLEQH